MSAAQTLPGSTTNLTVEDLEAALRLLSVETTENPSDWRKLALNLLRFISFAIVPLACPAGLLMLQFDRSLGAGLLIAAGLAVIVFGIISVFWGKYVGLSKQVKSLLEAGGLLEIAEAGWRKRQERIYLGVGCIGIVGLGVVLAGIIWLVYGLFTTHTANLASLTLIAAPIVAFFFLVAIQDYNEYQYYSQVSKLRARFEAHVQQTSVGGTGEITVSSEEKELLSRIEVKQIERKVAQATRGLSDELVEYYSVTIAADLLKLLEGSPDGDSIRRAIGGVADSLQVDPHPPNAQPAAGSEDTWWISSRNYRIIYQVSRDKRRIDIIQVLDAGGEEVSHAA